MTLRIASRCYFHSDDEVRGYLQRASELVDPAVFTEAERAQLLPQVVNLLSAGNVELEQVAIGVGHMDIPRGVRNGG